MVATGERTRPLPEPELAPRRPGLGVRCPEAQADGVPCDEIGRDCDECGRPRPAVKH
jgi:hypothetical protein